MAKLFSIIFIAWLIIFTLRVMSVGGIDPTYRDPPWETLLPFRNHLTSLVDKLLPWPQSALLSGILLGSQERIPFTLKQQLKNTSTIHMVVVSGQNLTILAGFVMSLVSILGRKKTIILTLGVIVTYSILTGGQVPVLRAALMATLAYLAQILGKEKVGWWTLLVVAGLMLLFNPAWLLNISFQLSFLATFGVIVVAPIFVARLTAIPSLLRQDLAVTLAAQLMVTPVIVYNFGQVSLIGILANSLILWVIPIVMVNGMMVLIAGSILIELGQVVGLISGVLLTYFIDIVKMTAAVPGASLMVGETSPIIWVGYYLILGAMILKISNVPPKAANLNYQIIHKSQ